MYGKSILKTLSGKKQPKNIDFNKKGSQKDDKNWYQKLTVFYDDTYEHV